MMMMMMMMMMMHGTPAAAEAKLCGVVQGM